MGEDNKTHALRTRDRMDKVSFSIFTVILFLLGVSTALDLSPMPKSLGESLQPIAHFSWTFLLIFGAPFALIGRLREKLEMEAAGCLALSLAFLTYMVAILGNNPSNGIGVAIIMGSLVVKYGYRSFVLNRLSKEARRGRRHPG